MSDVIRFLTDMVFAILAVLHRVVGAALDFLRPAADVIDVPVELFGAGVAAVLLLMLYLGLGTFAEKQR